MHEPTRAWLPRSTLPGQLGSISSDLPHDLDLMWLRSRKQSERALAAKLTIVIPTRNRPTLCTALVRFLRRQGFENRIVIADSSDEPGKAALRDKCRNISEIRSFAPDVDFYEKLIAAVDAIETSHVAMLPDDDITFPHAIAQCLEYLTEHPEATVAQGYVLDLGVHENVFDLLRVRYFTPSISGEDPLQRLYHLIRRYQPFFWGVFRKDALLMALRQAALSGLIYLQETTLVATLVLLGTFARIPCVHMLRGSEGSQTALEQIDPFFAMLADSDGFFARYLAYRENLVGFIERHAQLVLRPPEAVRHLLNLIHAIYWRRGLDGGIMEHTVQRLFDPSVPPIVLPPLNPQEQEIRCGDETLDSGRPGRRYIWRREVLQAEPREEITLTAAERACVTKALDDYELGELAPPEVATDRQLP